MIIRKYGWDTKSHAIIARLEGVIYPDSVIGYYILDADHLAALAEKEDALNDLDFHHKMEIAALTAERDKYRIHLFGLQMLREEFRNCPKSQYAERDCEAWKLIKAIEAALRGRRKNEWIDSYRKKLSRCL